jgi:hypothetical protein
MKTLTELYECVIKKKTQNEILASEILQGEKDIEQRLLKKCSAYKEINELIIKEEQNGEKFSPYNYFKILCYRDCKNILRKWLLENPNFIDEL